MMLREAREQACNIEHMSRDVHMNFRWLCLTSTRSLNEASRFGPRRALLLGPDAVPLFAGSVGGVGVFSPRWLSDRWTGCVEQLIKPVRLKRLLLVTKLALQACRSA